VPKHRDAFAAVADPTRRAILDLLRQRPSLTAGEIAAQFPHMSRPAISKHLGVLRRAGLVQALERGREWHYRLDPLPLGEIYTDWLARFAPLWETSLKQLKRQAEQAPASSDRLPLTRT
jgi:DNA-binding transcriptional ArsR family regulator